MSRYIATRAIRGANAIVAETELMLHKAITEKGADTPVAFPNTAYYLPVIHGMLGMKVTTLGDLRPVLEHAKKLLHPVPREEYWSPYLGETLDVGQATILAEETLEAVRFVLNQQPEPYPGFQLAGGTNYGNNGDLRAELKDGYLNGPIDDVQLRSWGIQLVDGRMPGFAAIVGAAKSNEVAVKIVRELQRRNILTFLCGNVNGRSIIDQLQEEGVEMGYDTFIVPFGRDTLSAIYALGFATRSALTFGGMKGGQWRNILLYNKLRVFAFVLALGEVDDLKYATAAGAISFGFPVVADTVIPEILPTGVTRYEHVVSMPFAEIGGKDDLERAERLVQKCIEVRGVKIKMTEVPIPVPYGAAFEGEVVRRTDMRMEFGGKETRTFEYLRMMPMDQVTDGDIQLIGPEVDDAPEGGAVSLGIVVEVAGRKMQTDFEPVLERQFHYFVNGASGIQHTGQRDITWIRISKSAADKGFKVRDLAKIIHARLHASFGAIVDKVQVRLITDPKLHAEWLAQAREAYTARNNRLANMTDESVETFYSCILCQSFAPNHVCVISPERLGLCGAYNWLDCRASYEINATGPNQPIAKGKCFDPKLGYWKGVNEYAVQASHGAVPRVSLYSIMNDPMTACGCFECSVMYIPEANGVAVISREDPGMTPTGMKFSTLAGICGGGLQNPGMMGIGKYYVLSPKFISADGGFKRVVWMSANLKQVMADELKAVAEREGDPELIDRIADGENVTEIDQLVSWLKEHKHPALEMAPMQTAEFDESVESAAEAAEPQPAAVASKTSVEESAKRVEAIPVEVQVEPVTVPIEKSEPVAEVAKAIEAPAAPIATQAPAAADVQAIAEMTANIVLGKMQNALIAMLRELGAPAQAGAVQIPNAAPTAMEIGQAAAAPVSKPIEAAQAAAPAEAPAQVVEAKAAQTTAPTVVEPKAQIRTLKATKHDVLGAPWLSNGAATLQLHKEKWTGNIVPVTLGATAAQGGTRSRTVTVGGENNLPYLFDEGTMPHAPVLGLEILDKKPSDWSPLLLQTWEGVMDDPAVWAKAAEAKGAEAILLRLSATKADESPNTPENVRATVRKVLKATGLPLIVFGPGQAELDGEFLVAAAEEGKGERLALGLCEQGNYRTIVAAAMANDQLVVTSTAMDVNLAKQLAILVADMGMPTDRVLMDPTCAGVGYGIEYGYSVMERLRLAALTGDKMTQSPIVLAVGYEAWRQKESRVGEGVPKQWGDWMERAINWETLTAAPLIEVGADMLLLRHPESLRRIRALIAEMMVGAGQRDA